MYRGHAKNDRIDVNYWYSTTFFDELYAEPKFPLVPLRNLVTLVQYGISERATSEIKGVPILRMNNLQAEGWNLDDLKYIELDESTKQQFLLQPGDLLFNRTNSKELVGKCDVFVEQGEWVFASYLIRVRANQEKVDPFFISEFLSTNAGRVQIARTSRQIIGMTNINAEELKDLVIPLPPHDHQHTLVRELQAAREQRHSKLAEADSLLGTMDGWLLEKLGIQIATPPNRVTYATKAGDVNTQQRMNADYFHPERILTLRAIAEQFVHLSPTPLHEVAYFLRDRSNASVDPYLGLARVQSNTGELTETTEDIEGECLLFKENDVLFAKLRPYLNKVYRAEFAGSCSPEFHVIRIRQDRDVMPDYLATILRSRLIVSQTKHMMTGNTHPRITSDDVVNLVIPIPDKAIQVVIVEEVQRRRAEARRLRAEAELEWNAAKANFEAQLLSGVKV